MVSNNEFLRELHYLRRRDYQELKDLVGQIESSYQQHVVLESNLLKKEVS